MNRDDQFEERLQGQPSTCSPSLARRHPALRACRRQNSRVPLASRRSWFSASESKLAALLWPRFPRRAWGGSAALWLLILRLGFAARDSAPHQPQQAASSSPQMRELLRQQEQLLAELMGPLDQPVADRRRTARLSRTASEPKDFPMPEPDTTPPPSSLFRDFFGCSSLSPFASPLSLRSPTPRKTGAAKRPGKNPGQWEAKGESFDFSALLPPPVPEAENFAQTPLLKPLYEFTTSPVVWRDTNTLTRLHEISANLSNAHNRSPDEFKLGNLEQGTLPTWPALAAFYRENTNYPQAAASATPGGKRFWVTALGKFDAQLGELREAAASPAFVRFDIHYDKEPVSTILLPHLSVIKGCIILTSARATAELEAHRSADAVADLKLGFRLADSITNEFFLIDHLVRIAGLSINLQTVREGLHRNAWTDAQLAELESYLAGLDVLAGTNWPCAANAHAGCQGWILCAGRDLKPNPFATL